MQAVHYLVQFFFLLYLKSAWDVRSYGLVSNTHSENGTSSS